MQNLVERTLAYAIAIRKLVKKLPSSLKLDNDIRQLLRSSGSIGANYLEAQEALSRRDFLYRSRISRKEAVESRHWLFLIKAACEVNFHPECESLINETSQLIAIFTSICKKIESSK